MALRLGYASRNQAGRLTGSVSRRWRPQPTPTPRPSARALLSGWMISSGTRSGSRASPPTDHPKITANSPGMPDPLAGRIRPLPGIAATTQFRDARVLAGLLSQDLPNLQPPPSAAESEFLKLSH